ncbi:MAG: hypothetical protein E7554_08800 [Ruminococcaceae bacterium]|nr:hypothetical protein [Oscillospiraceae bacterium]
MAKNNQSFKLQRTLNKLAIHNLMLYIVGGIAAVFLIGMALYMTKGIDIIEYITFNRSMILDGQVWRVLTFLFKPEDSSVFMVLTLYLYWLMGSTLEQEWGAVKFNLFYFCGAALTIASGFITGGAVNHFLNMSLFFAFAILNPEFQLMLFFVLPVKIKWLAIADAVYFAYMFVVSGWDIRGCIIACALTLLIFFGGDIIESIKRAKRRAEWKRNFR